MQEAKEAFDQVKLIIADLSSSKLPTVSFLGETCRMGIEVEDYQAVADIAEVTLALDETMVRNSLEWYSIHACICEV